ncbi:Vitopine synthase [Colletotrichum trifolii]|uniref:Vitopine synthase n=1 Tax=Colletotrichum trifolii TaxID=5466 RepID=A0A4R8QTQ4_COLTR|nr:Vitopine synthase [Colletotrichum trifolii]
MTRVSVLGAGPAGFALAADLQQNHETDTLLYSHPAHARHARTVMETGRLELSCAMDGFTHVRLTTDMAEAVAFSQTLILTVPSTGQPTLLDELRRHDLRRHTVIAVPGNLFSLLAGVADLGCANVLETNLSPYSCRMDEGGRLVVFGRKRVVSIAALRTAPPSLRRHVQAVFPVELRWCDNVVEACLSNVNGVFHPLMMLMNAGRIESTAGDFLLYRDGLTPAVASAMEAVDAARVAVAARLGLRTATAVDISNECYGQAFADLVDLARGSPPHNRLRAPAGFDHRNMSEDVGDLLVAWHGLAVKLGVDASPIAAVIVLAKMATGVDYAATGRTLDKLQLEDCTGDDIVGMFGGSSHRRPSQTQSEARL